MKISCVVVTYNRLDTLKDSLDAILKQTLPVDQLVVVDNCSTDGTREYLTELGKHAKELKAVFMPTNTGGAGGFNEGFKVAYAGGADYVWCMDDDCIANPDALEKLCLPLETTLKDDAPGLLASRVEWIDGSICFMNTPCVDRDWPEYQSRDPNLVRIWSASFVSVLVSREAIELAGFPIKEFFIWYDDCEFTSRIAHYRKCFAVQNSVVVHHTKENIRPMDFSHATKESVWKFASGVRNETACYMESRKSGVIFGLIHTAKRTIQCYQATRSIGLSSAILKGGVKGLFFQYKKYIEHPAKV